MNCLKLLLAYFFIICFSLPYAQEAESDLYAVSGISSLSLFMQSEKTTMTVITYRNSSKGELVEEHTTTYKKGKINTDRINFTITYTPYFVLDDRKKSLGKYELNTLFEVVKYERTDFNTRNMRTFTYYHSFNYDNNVLKREVVRTKEYVGTGSVDMDTVVTVDSTVYIIKLTDRGIEQKDLSEGGATTTYIIEAGKLLSKTRTLTGFSEEINYVYDGNNQPVVIKNSLIGEDGQRISNTTKIRHSIDGLITEVLFYDQYEKIIEKKVFTYK